MGYVVIDTIHIQFCKTKIIRVMKSDSRLLK